jgi:hypothetical protein
MGKVATQPRRKKIAEPLADIGGVHVLDRGQTLQTETC